MYTQNLFREINFRDHIVNLWFSESYNDYKFCIGHGVKFYTRRYVLKKPMEVNVILLQCKSTQVEPTFRKPGG